MLVPFGRGGRQAIGVVVGPGATVAGGPEIRPIAARVRSDGPLLPPLSLRFAAVVADRYLAPLATVIRAMLPPGMLERLELVAEVTPAGEARLGQAEPGLGAVELDLLDELAGRPRPVRDLSTPEGRAALLRRLRALADAGLIELTWTLLGAALGPRYERRLWLTADGTAAAARLRRRRAPRRAGSSGRGRSPRCARWRRRTPRGTRTGRPAAPLAERHGASAVAGLVRRGLVRAEVRERPRRPLAGRPAGIRGARPAGSDLTDAQAAALAIVNEAIERRDPTPTLLDGVTGGGKTAIYVEAIAACLATGRPALLLVPEIALSTPIVDRLRTDLPVRVGILHSALGEGERADEWRRIRAGEADVVVGTRTALLAPLADLGLVIVDEEHEAAYKSDRTPRLPGARRRARAGPDRRRRGRPRAARRPRSRASATRVRAVTAGPCCPVRPAGTEPRVTAVDMRAELAAGNRGLLSDSLAAALAALDTAAGERAILVINRRGTASVVVCRDCGHVQSCPDCDRPLVYHRAGTSLRCHHCGRAWPTATRCPACASPRIRYLGGGTERVEREVRERFGDLRVGRLDRDVAERKGAADRVLDAFAAGRLDVLVGTSLVAKGLDVPEVTLVGIVSADIALNLPDERASERTYQLLAQAVGRAGRGDRPGVAFIQTYRPDHRAIRAVVEGDAATFYDEELALRERFGSPPFGRLVKLTVGLPDRDAAEREATAMAERLRAADGRRAALDPGRRAGAGLRRPAGRPVAVQRGPPRPGSGRAPRPAAGRAVVRRRRSREPALIPSRNDPARFPSVHELIRWRTIDPQTLTPRPRTRSPP